MGKMMKEIINGKSMCEKCNVELVGIENKMRDRGKCPECGREFDISYDMELNKSIVEVRKKIKNVNIGDIVEYKVGIFGVTVSYGKVIKKLKVEESSNELESGSYIYGIKILNSQGAKREIEENQILQVYRTV